MIRFTCTNCRQPLEVGPQYAGKQARCSGCGQMQSVPSVGAVVAPQGAGVPVPTVRSSTAPTRPNLTLQLTCSACGQWLEVEDEQLGQMVRCPRCGHTQSTPPLTGASVVGETTTPPVTERETRRRRQAYLWVLGGGFLGVFFGISAGAQLTSDAVGTMRAIIGLILGAGVGAIFVAMWGFRTGAIARMGGWLVVGAIVGAVLGATVLTKEQARAGALGGALVGGILGSLGGLAGAAVWRHLDRG